MLLTLRDIIDHVENSLLGIEPKIWYEGRYISTYGTYMHAIIFKPFGTQGHTFWYKNHMYQIKTLKVIYKHILSIALC